MTSSKNAFALVAGLAWLAATLPVNAQDADTPGADEAAEESPSVAETVAAVDPDQPRAMSGMSILGNEEAPKALVIIPWKSSELGDEIGIPESPDDKATPVDKDVFLRELRFYEIRRSDAGAPQ